MPVYYSDNISGDRALLDEEESRHCIRVLRLKKGDSVKFVDGRGTMYDAVILDPDPMHCGLNILDSREKYLGRDYRLHVAIAPTKSMDRFEWFLEKATEIGVDEITPLICERSERRTIRMDRCRKILVSAMKQSGRAYLPVLHNPVDFERLSMGTPEGIQLIAHCKAGEEDYLGKLDRSGNWLVLIGPEGDFIEEEISLARESGFAEVSLGDAVLRTETAGVVACQILASLHYQ